MTEVGKTQGASLGGRLVFWDFARASWQYDVVVGLILIFIFATPRDWFHDQPKAASVILMSSGNGSNSVFIATGLLRNVPAQERSKRAEALIHKRTGKKWRVTRVEPICDEAEQEIKGFVAYTTP
ncbi:MAG: hypothetical protein M3Y72_16940 [Acidobacteriota bacterium]|nr:hypothetical protein [Acidobacteriota bacterium]